MLNELKKCERAWVEFADFLSSKSCFVKEGEVWRVRPGMRETISKAELHALCISFLDEKGIYVWIRPIRLSKGVIAFNVGIYTEWTDDNDFASRPLAEEAGIIKAFQIYEEQLEREK